MCLMRSIPRGGPSCPWWASAGVAQRASRAAQRTEMCRNGRIVNSSQSSRAATYGARGSRRRMPRKRAARMDAPLARRRADERRARSAPGPRREGAGSAQERVDVVGPDPDLLVVLLAELDVVVHVEEVHGVAVLVQPDQRPAYLEVHLHRLVGLVRDERVRLARRLVDEAARRRDPVVLEVAPLAGDRVREDLVRVVVPVDEAGPGRPQHVAPAVLRDGDPDRPGADRLAQRHVVALVVGRDLRGEHLREGVLLEDLLDRLEVPPELGSGGFGHALLLGLGAKGHGAYSRARQPSRSSRRSTLPVAVFGISSITSTCRGYLYAAMRSLQNAMSSSAPADEPSLRLTYAFTVSPRYSSGTPTTAASRTAGWP